MAELLCQDCWQERNPDDYAPISHEDGECSKCGTDAMLYDAKDELFAQQDRRLAQLYPEKSLEDITSEELLALDREAFLS